MMKNQTLKSKELHQDWFLKKAYFCKKNNNNNKNCKSFCKIINNLFTSYNGLVHYVKEITLRLKCWFLSRKTEVSHLLYQFSVNLPSYVLIIL